MSVSTTSKDEVTKVVYEKGHLTATGSAGKCEMRALTQTKFYCVHIEVALQFNKDSYGRVIGVTEEWADHNEGFKKVK
jgi:hypothetical protein